MRRPSPASPQALVHWMARRVRPGDLRHDLVAGVVLSALLVPAGMGYAQAAGLDPVYGLYASLAPLVAYALFGPSPILILGPDSSLVPLIAATVISLGGSDPARRVAVAAMLAVLAGSMCVIGGVARFGFVTELLSLPVRYGYLNGIALLVAVGQLPRLLGVPSDGDGLVAVSRDVVRGVSDGRANGTALAVGVAVLGVVITLRRFAPKLPGVLIGVAGAALATVVFNLRSRGLDVVGPVPRGLPAPAWPSVRAGDAGALVAGAFGIAMVSFADTSLLSRAYASKTNTDVDANHELVALGVANIASGLFQGFSVSASASRTPAAEAAGARSQMTGLFGAATIAVILLAAPGVFRDLPTAALAAIVIAAAASLVEIRPLVALAQARPSELALSLITFGGIAFAGAIRGVLVAIAVSLIAFILKAWRPHTTTLVRVDGLKGYHDSERHPEGRTIPGLVLYRFDAPLFFANAELFRQQVLHHTRPDADVRWLVVTAEPVTDVDATGAAMLATLHEELRRRDVVIAFAELKGHVRERLDRFGLVERFGRDRFYRTVGEAVHAYLAEENVSWTDWENRPRPDEP